MKDKIFGVLQRVGRSFMLPIAILPVAGLLLGIGSSFTNATTIETYGLTAILGEGTLLHALLTIKSRVGSAEGKGSIRTVCGDRIFCYEYSNQRHADVKWQDLR